MRPLLFVLLLGACAYPRPELPDGPVHIVIDEDVRTHLHEVQAFFPLETILCLTGGTVGPFVVISNLQIADQTNRTPTSVRYTSCPQRDFLGIAHNHPHRDGCDFSRPDSMSFAHMRYALIDVVVGRRCIRVTTRNGQQRVFER